MEMTPTEQEVRAFVGSNADYYLKAWYPVLNGEDRVTGFNLAACFLMGLWLGYRKLYFGLFILFGIVLVETVVEEVVFIGILQKEEPPKGLISLFGIIAGIIGGLYGNRWYLAHMKRVIAELRSLHLSEEDYLESLAIRGGTNIAASIGLFILQCFILLAVLVVVEMCFAQP